MQGHLKIVVVGFVFFFTFTLWAFSINFQGKVTDHSGKAYNGTLVSVCMVLKQLPGDLIIDTACVYDVSVDRGLFSVNLDVDSLPRDAITGDKRLVGVVVISDSTGEPQRLDPPIEITFAPLAYGARVAAVAETAYALSSEAVETRFISADSARIGSTCSPKNPILDVYGSTQTPYPPDLTSPPDSIINVPVVRITAKLCDEALDVGETRVDSFATTALQIILDTLDLGDSIVGNEGNAIEVLKTIKKDIGWRRCTTFVVSGTETLGVYIHRCDTSDSGVGLKVTGYQTAAYFENNIQVEDTARVGVIKAGNLWGQMPLRLGHWEKAIFFIATPDSSDTSGMHRQPMVVRWFGGEDGPPFTVYVAQKDTPSVLSPGDWVVEDTLLKVITGFERDTTSELVIRFWGTAQVDSRIIGERNHRNDLKRTAASLVPGGYLGIVVHFVGESDYYLLRYPKRLTLPFIQEGLPAQSFFVESVLPISSIADGIDSVEFMLAVIPFDYSLFSRNRIWSLTLFDVTAEVRQVKY